MRFASPFRLAACGIVGMNRRNHAYISRYNRRSLYPLVDDKLKTKVLAKQAGITTPELYGVIRFQHDIRTALPSMLAARADFVIKPSKGSGGNGILVISEKEGDAYLKANGNIVTMEDIFRHTSNILSGLYSLGGSADKALIEYRVKFSTAFSHISYQGVPDLRIIVFLGYPVMAMMRLPTRASDGKANLHQGAVGVGIDIPTGQTLFGVVHNRPVSVHPDTKNSFSSLIIPEWDGLLALAAGCYEMTGLGYIGVDIVIDAQKGPMILELNARPGLAIQIANHEGLGTRLESVEREARYSRGVDERVAFVKSHFPSRHLQKPI